METNETKTKNHSHAETKKRNLNFEVASIKNRHIFYSFSGPKLEIHRDADNDTGRPIITPLPPHLPLFRLQTKLQQQPLTTIPGL